MTIALSCSRSTRSRSRPAPPRTGGRSRRNRSAGLRPALTGRRRDGHRLVCPMSAPSGPRDVLRFATQAGFEAWLEDHHAQSPGVWLQIAKKNATRPTVTYADAIQAALSFGWIDGQKRRGDGEHWLQRF